MDLGVEQDLHSYLSSIWEIDAFSPVFPSKSSQYRLFQCIKSDQTKVACKLFNSFSFELEQEVQLWGILKHPGIVTQYGYFRFESKNECFLCVILEHCDRNVKEIMQEKRSFGEEELWEGMKRMVGGLAYAQGMGVAHGDVCPENVYVTGKGEVKIGNWGRRCEAEYITTKNSLFLSPLQKTGLMSCLPVSHNPFKSDIYSLGLTILSMASTDLPIGLLTNKDTPEVCVDRLQCSMELKDILKGMMRGEEEERYDAMRLWERLSPSTRPTTELVQASEAVQTFSHPKKPKKGKDLEAPIVCIWRKCGRTVTKRTKQVSQLNCHPQHGFCSKRCFSEFLSSTRDKDKDPYPKCPACSTPISQDILRRFGEQIQGHVCTGCSLQ